MLTYTPEIHAMTASQVWDAWKKQLLTVGQVETWQRKHKHFFKEENNMAYKRKTRDRWDIMTNYGFGWECECSAYTWPEAKADAKAYRENTHAAVRIEKHREKLEV